MTVSSSLFPASRRQRRLFSAPGSRLLVRLGLVSMLSLGVSAGSAPKPVPASAAAWTRIGDKHPSYLQIPSNCTYVTCPLVIVSHPRAQDAARMRDSAGVSVITRALLKANFAVLLSSDGGVNTWGSPQALAQVAAIQKDATRRFRWNGRIYALGISMGGLLSLRSALPGAPYKVGGVALMDSWVNLSSAWSSAESRRREITHAYGITALPGAQLDPLPLTKQSAPTPLFVVYSNEDTVVPAKHNAELLKTHAEQEVSRFVQVKGPHLGGNRFTPELAGQLVAFYQRLEQRAKTWQAKEFPGIPIVIPAAGEVGDRLRRFLGRANA